MMTDTFAKVRYFWDGECSEIDTINGPEHIPNRNKNALFRRLFI